MSSPRSQTHAHPHARELKTRSVQVPMRHFARDRTRPYLCHIRSEADVEAVDADGHGRSEGGAELVDHVEGVHAQEEHRGRLGDAPVRVMRYVLVFLEIAWETNPPENCSKAGNPCGVVSNLM